MKNLYLGLSKGAGNIQTFIPVTGEETDRLPLTEQDYRKAPSGHLFARSQLVAMGADPSKTGNPEVAIITTQGGFALHDGTPIAYGAHTGNHEIWRQTVAAAKRFSALGVLPRSAYVSDPCDGMTQGTTGMFDSLSWRNDAAVVMGRQIRSFVLADRVMSIGTCDKAIPALLMALASHGKYPGIHVNGGVSLPPSQGRNAGTIQAVGTEVSQGILSLDAANREGCMACGIKGLGGGCQFLGTAATNQVIAEALGITLPHTALLPAGQQIWLDTAEQSAEALNALAKSGKTIRDIMTADAFYNAMVVHAAFGGSTNLFLHIPAIMFNLGLERPTVDGWEEVNNDVQRVVSVLPNGPVHHPTIRVFLAGGVPEVMLHLRNAGKIKEDALTVTGEPWGEILDAWEKCDRRGQLREHLKEKDGVDPDDVIMPIEKARSSGITTTICFPKGNIAKEGSFCKSTAIHPAFCEPDGSYRHLGQVKFFTSEQETMDAIKGIGKRKVEHGDIVVLAGYGPRGACLPELFQVTGALKQTLQNVDLLAPDTPKDDLEALRAICLKKKITFLTDGRFSGVSTGACIGNISPEAIDERGFFGRLRDGDWVEVIIPAAGGKATLNMIGHKDTASEDRCVAKGNDILRKRRIHPDVKPHAEMHPDGRLWGILQAAGGGSWSGCVYDVEAIEKLLTAGREALAGS